MACRCRSCKEERAKVRTELVKCTQYHPRAQRERKFLGSLLQSSENTVHSRFCRLPVELQTKIFEYATVIDFPRPAVDPRVKKNNRFLLLGAVCHLWRAIAWGTPLLWQSLSIYIYQRNPRLIAQLAYEWLERSEPMVELNIRLYTHRSLEEPRGFDEKVGALVEVINPFSYRWGTLNLEIPFPYAERVRAEGSASMLRSLMIHQTDLEPEQPAPTGPLWRKQQNLMVQVIGRQSPGIENLKRVHFSLLLNDAGIGQGLYYAFLSKQLEELVIDGMNYSIFFTEPTLTLELLSRPITRPCLRVLRLERVPANFVLKFLEWAILPNLEFLNIVADLTPTRIYDSFFSHCSTSLKTLQLVVAYNPQNFEHVHDYMLVNTLAATPYVQSLSVNYFYHCQILNFREPQIYGRLLYALTREIDIGHGKRPLLPHLQALVFHSQLRPKFQWECIPMLFYPPQNGPNLSTRRNPKFLPSQRPLRYVGVRIENAEEMFIIDRQTLTQLSDIAKSRRVKFEFSLFIGEPARGVDILKTSAASYGLVWNDNLR